MPITLSAIEWRSFFFFITLFLVSFVLLFFENQNVIFLALVAQLLGFFGLFRLAYFIDEVQSMPRFVSLPARLLFGLSEAEEQYKKQVLHRLQKTDIYIWLGVGFLYLIWLMICCFNVFSSSEISNLFERDVPVVPALSYINMYETLRGISFIGIIALISFLSLTYSQHQKFLKCGLIIFLPVFIMAYIFEMLNVQFVFTLPPFYTSLIQGIGLGKGALLFDAQPDIFITSPTSLFMRYIETGLVGVMCFYALFVPIIFMFFRALLRSTGQNYTALIGFIVLGLLFALDSFVVQPEYYKSLVLLGQAVVALCWGACLKPDKA